MPCIKKNYLLLCLYIIFCKAGLTLCLPWGRLRARLIPLRTARFYGMLIARYFIIKPYERAVCFFFLLKQHTAALLKQLKTRGEGVPIWNSLTYSIMASMGSPAPRAQYKLRPADIIGRIIPYSAGVRPTWGSMVYAFVISERIRGYTVFFAHFACDNFCFALSVVSAWRCRPPLLYAFFGFIIYLGAYSKSIGKNKFLSMKKLRGAYYTESLQISSNAILQSASYGSIIYTSER